VTNPHGAGKVLDGAASRDLLIRHIEGGGTRASAARMLEINPRTITRYAAAHPDFAERLDAALHRAETVKHYVGREARTKGRKAIKAAIIEDRPPPDPPVQAPAQIPATQEVIEPEVIGRGPRQYVPYSQLTEDELCDRILDRCGEVFEGSEDSKGWAMAGRILEAWAFGARLHAARKRVEREAAAEAESGSVQRMPILELPRNGAEAPGREPAPRGVVIDVEVTSDP